MEKFAGLILKSKTLVNASMVYIIHSLLHPENI